MDNPGEILRLCRLCLVKDQVNIPIFEEQGDIRQIFLKISSCLPVKVSRDDKLPKQICDGCSNKLDLLYEFWNNSANAEKTLLSWLGQAGVKDADETISAVAQQISKPSETQVKEEAVEDGQTANQSQDLAQSFQEEAKDESEAPPPKRARRTAAVKAQINIAPESDEDDDMDNAEAMTKIEDESDESDGEDRDPTYSEGPGTSADDQAGPSGVSKDGAEAPTKPTFPPKLRSRTSKFECYVCHKSFSTKNQIVNHFKCLTFDFTIKCNVCQISYLNGQNCDHKDEHKVSHCAFCGEPLEEPRTFHICFHLKTEKVLSRKSGKNDTDKHCDKSIPSGFRRKGRPKKDEAKEDEVRTLYLESLIEVNESLNLSLEKEEIKYASFDYDSDVDNTDLCIYCDKKMTSEAIGRHEEWHRKNDKNVKKLSEMTTKRPSKNDESLCSFCGIFKPSNKLRRHEYVDHIKKFVKKVCDVCGVFTCPTYIKEHMRTHDAVQGFRCEVCGKAFFRKKALARHRLVHSDVAQYACTICGKTFKIKFNLRVHMRTHEDVKPFACSVCKKTFTTKQWRDNHMKTHGIVANRKATEKSKKHSCPSCSANFSSSVKLSQHLNNLSVETMCYCSSCDIFIGPGSRCNDLKESEKFHCNFCKSRLQCCQFDNHDHFHKEVLTTDDDYYIEERVFRKSTRLKEKKAVRKRKLHSIEKNSSDDLTLCKNDMSLDEYSCETVIINDSSDNLNDYVSNTCDSDSFKMNVLEDTDLCMFCSNEIPLSNLERHENAHREEEKRRAKQHRNPIKKDGNMVCTICGATVPSKDLKKHERSHRRLETVICTICGFPAKNIYQHMASHSDVRKFACQVCGLAFKHKKNLHTHMLVHDAVGKHICSTCGKTFKTPYSVRVHMRSHQDIKPFPCQFCDKTFTTKQSRNNHQKTHITHIF